MTGVAQSLLPGTQGLRRCVAQRLQASLAPVAAGLALLALASPAYGQSIEPRSYSNAPIGVDFLLSGVAHSQGGAVFDPALPVTNPDLSIWSAYAAFAHVFAVGGQSARWALVVPYASLDGEADYNGNRVSRSQSGLADVLARVSVNLSGAPALDLQEFGQYQQDLVVGASLEVSAPTGAYDNTRVVNIGTHRWSVKPELGVSKALGDWVFEAAGAVTVFSDNSEFLGAQTRSQAPVYSLQLHTVYTFRPGLWVSLSATYFRGGRTTLDGVDADDRQDNTRLGGTLTLPLNRYHSLKLSASNGVTARRGSDFTLVALSWQTRWGGGL